MLRTLLKSKLHRATVTHCELHSQEMAGFKPRVVFMDQNNRLLQPDPQELRLLQEVA